MEYTNSATLQCKREEQANIPHFCVVFEVTFALHLFLQTNYLLYLSYELF